MQFSGKFQETSENGSEPYFGPDFDLFAQKFGPPIFFVGFTSASMQQWPSG